MPKFEVGEVAVHKVTNQEVEILDVLDHTGIPGNLIMPGSRAEYGVYYELDDSYVHENRLRKRKPPADADELIGWDKLCDKMGYHPPKELDHA